ncbi:hypothetical protein OHA37_33120 [Streptomyces sp. NBC_00335]|uniref:hypothetical protein n=1 Tax=unclassified Streptomyces TaxID=2593676 RepID=UPI002258044C|nr:MULTISPECIES: hypothetical protein [unclassified Streptomyces]MCX5408682.1 hypothetical protein [Streptomyces sp. NBC_00086]
MGRSHRHPELFEKAIAYEEKVNYRRNAMQGREYTWSQGESLHELIERRDESEAKHQAALDRAAKPVKPNRPLLEILADAHDEDDDEAGCAVWWFEQSTAAELTGLLLTSSKKQAAALEPGRVGLLDRGMPMLIAVSAATASVKEDSSTADGVGEAGTILATADDRGSCGAPC